MILVSLPIKGLSDSKINIIRVYTNKEHIMADGTSAYKIIKNYMDTIDDRWLDHVHERESIQKRYKEIETEKEVFEKRFK